MNLYQELKVLYCNKQYLLEISMRNFLSKVENNEYLFLYTKPFWSLNQVNKDFVLYEEIRSLIVKAQVLYEKDFVEKIKKVGKPKLLILTGVFANNLESPIDILLVGRINKPKFLRIVKELENDMGRELNYTLLDYKEYKYRRDITDVFCIIF